VAVAAEAPLQRPVEALLLPQAAEVPPLPMDQS